MFGGKFAGLLLGFFSFCASTWAAAVPASLSRLEDVKSKTIRAEQSLMDSLNDEHLSRDRVKRLRDLQALQRQEGALLAQRLRETEKFILELERRASQVRERLALNEGKVRVLLRELGLSQGQEISFDQLPDESVEAARRLLIARLVDRVIKEIETLKADNEDALKLDQKIQLERERLAASVQDLTEQEGWLKFNSELEKDILAQRHRERLGQLNQVHELRKSQAQLEGLLKDFNARVELEEVKESQKKVHLEMAQGGLIKKKGMLKWPVVGQLVSNFGRAIDPDTRLPVFKKGVEILSRSGHQNIASIFAGKVVYAGELPHYGRVVIVDHGGHVYSLYGGLGEFRKGTGETVREGEAVGVSDDGARPVYFEIREHNVAVNPLQWVSASSKISS